MHNVPVGPLNRIVTRRNFLGTAAVGASSLIVPAWWGPLGVAAVPEVIPVPNSLPALVTVVPLDGAPGEFLRRVLRFLASSIRYVEVAQNIAQWFPALNQTQRTKVHSDHALLQARGYEDPGAKPDTSIFGSGGSRRCVYYPADRRGESAADGIAPFYDFCTCTCVAQLAAPTMVGLQNAAIDLIQAGNSPPTVSRCLVPDRNQSSTSFGLWRQYYSAPDRYVAEDGTRVAVNYEPVNNTPSIRVTAVRDNLSGTTMTLLDRNYAVELSGLG
jgi:hypothetical protein